MAWIEIGPHPVFIGFAQSILPSLAAAVHSLRQWEDDWKTISQSLAALHMAGAQVGWSEFHSPFERTSGLRLLDFPTYAWNDKDHWIQYHGDWALTKGNCLQRREGHGCGVKSSTKPFGCSSPHPSDVPRPPGCRGVFLWLGRVRRCAVECDAGGLLGRGLEPSDERSRCGDISKYCSSPRAPGTAEKSNMM